MTTVSHMQIDISVLPKYWRDRILGFSQSAQNADSNKISLKNILFMIRDMPYARPIHGNSAEACITEWKGTCSAKHLATYELLKLAGYSPRFWMASFRIDFDRAFFSKALKQSSRGVTVYDIHNYLTCSFGADELIIDITFPLSLEKFGFPVTRNWNGIEDFLLCCAPEERVELNVDKETDLRKRIWLNRLNSEMAMQLRERAIVEMMEVASAATS